MIHLPCSDALSHWVSKFKKSSPSSPSSSSSAASAPPPPPPSCLAIPSIFCGKKTGSNWQEGIHRCSCGTGDALGGARGALGARTSPAATAGRSGRRAQSCSGHGWYLCLIYDLHKKWILKKWYYILLSLDLYMTICDTMWLWWVIILMLIN